MTRYYDLDYPKRSRGVDEYTGQGSNVYSHSSSSARYSSVDHYGDYSSGSGGGSSSSSRYRSPSSYYDLPKSSSSLNYSSKHLPSSSSYYSGRSSKFDDLRGSSGSGRRAPSPYSHSSQSSRLPSLMKVDVASRSRDNFGSRLRHAPPEDSHGRSTYSSSSRKPDVHRKASSILNKYSAYVAPRSSYPLSKHSARPASTSLRRVTATITKPKPRLPLKKIKYEPSPTRRYVSHRRPLPPKRVPRKRSGSHGHDKHSGHAHSHVRSHSHASTSRSKENRTNKEEKKERKIIRPEPSKEKPKVEQVQSVAAVDVLWDEDNMIVEEEVGPSDDDEHEDNMQSSIAQKEAKETEVEKKDDKNVAESKTKSSESDKMPNQKSKVTESGKENKTPIKEKEVKKKKRGSPAPRALLKFKCCYCDLRCVSLRDYTTHTRSYDHTNVMRKTVSDMRKKLLDLREKQRDEQRQLEKEAKLLSDTTSYCRVCELNLRTDPKEHESTSYHKKIKEAICQRCEVCDIDFRIWKVYLHHLCSVEHVKKVALRELQAGERSGQTIKGSNLTESELGMEMLEERTVFYCSACMRYIPIKENPIDNKRKHCMTLNHIKFVEEIQHRERKQEKLKRDREVEEERKVKKVATEESLDDASNKKSENKEQENQEEKEKESNVQNIKEESGISDCGRRSNEEDDQFQEDKAEDSEVSKGKRDEGVQNVPSTAASAPLADDRNDGDELDEPEIELHAENDVNEDMDDSESWTNRTTRSRASRSAMDMDNVGKH